MKKVFLSSALLLVLAISFTSCRETENKADEKVIIIEETKDNTSTTTDGALEKAGRAIDNAAKEVKEAGKAVDSAAKEVVNDDN